MRTVETRGLLAGAYKGKRLLDRTLLTHAIAVADDGQWLRVLCGTVPVDSVAGCDDDDTAAAPTCPRCAKKDPRRLREGEEPGKVREALFPEDE